MLLPDAVGTCAAFTRAGLLLPLAPGISKSTSASISLRRKVVAGFWGAGSDLSWVLPMNVTALVELTCVCAIVDAAGSSQHTPKKDNVLMIFILVAPQKSTVLERRLGGFAKSNV